MNTTLLFTGHSVGLELAIGLGMALVMHQAFRGRPLLRAVVLVPWAILTVVTAITWRTIFEPELGFVNTMLSALGAAGRGHRLARSSEGYALAVMILADVWKTAPFMALLILAGLQGIPDELHDAAKVDGASTWQRFRTDHPAPARAGDHGGADLPHPRRDAGLRPSLRADQGRQRHRNAVADRTGGARHQPQHRASGRRSRCSPSSP